MDAKRRNEELLFSRSSKDGFMLLGSTRDGSLHALMKEELLLFLKMESVPIFVLQTGIVLDLLEEPKDPSLVLNALDSYGCYLDNIRANYNKFVWDNSKEDDFVDFITSILNS